MTKDEALTVALQQIEVAVEYIDHLGGESGMYRAALVGLKKSFAQPEQEPVSHAVIAGALFDFMGYLTSLKKRIVLSASDDAAPAVDAIRDFAEKRGLSLNDAQVREWIDALAQPEQEPVAWMTINEYGEEDDIHYENPEGHLLEGWTYKPLYTHPPTAQTEKEPLEYWNAVEGWVKIDEVREHFGSVGCGTIYKTAGEDRVPVYTTPPQREWVGLTENEIESIEEKALTKQWAIRMALTAAQEKNND